MITYSMHELARAFQPVVKPCHAEDRALIRRQRVFA